MIAVQAVQKSTTTKAAPDHGGIFNFPQGIAGFSNTREYGFIYQGHGDIVCIQSTDHPEAAFLLTPWNEQRLGPVPTLPADQRLCIHASEQNQIMWMLVLNPFADKQWVTANLKAPIALNPETHTGMQYIRQEPDLEIRYHWQPQPN